MLSGQQSLDQLHESKRNQEQQYEEQVQVRFEMYAVARMVVPDCLFLVP